MAEAKAVLRYVRMTPRKVRMVVDLIRGRAVPEALAMLKYLPRAAAPGRGKGVEVCRCECRTKGVGGCRVVENRKGLCGWRPCLKAIPGQIHGAGKPHS